MCFGEDGNILRTHTSSTWKLSDVLERDVVAIDCFPRFFTAVVDGF